MRPLIQISISFLILNLLISKSLFAKYLPNSVTTVLVIDVSGSMSSNDPNYRALDSAALFVDLLSEGDEVGLVFFNGGIAKKAGLFYITEDQESSKKPIKDIIYGMKYDGGTEIIGALQEGLRMLQTSKFLNEKDRDFSLILMTDGEDLNPIQAYNRMKLDAASKGVIIHPIAYGQEALASSSRRKLSNLTTNQLLTVERAEDLPASFATVYGRIHEVFIKPFKPSGGGYNFNVHPLTIETNIILASQSLEASHSFSIADPSGNRYDTNVQGKSYFGRGREFLIGKLINIPPGDRWLMNANFSPNTGILFQVPDLEFKYQWGSFNIYNPEIIVEKAYLHQKSKKIHYKEPSFYNKAKIYLVMEGVGGDKEEVELLDNGQGYDSVSGDYVFAGSIGLFKPGLFQYYLELRHEDFQIRSERYLVALDPLIIFHAQDTSDIVNVNQGSSYSLNIEPMINTGFSKNNEILTLNLIQKPEYEHQTIQLKETVLSFNQNNTKNTIQIATKLGYPWFFFMDGTPEGEYQGSIELKYMSSNPVLLNYKFYVTSLPLWKRILYSLVFWVCLFFLLFIIWRVKNSHKFPRHFYVLHVTPDILQDYQSRLKRIYTNFLAKETKRTVGGIQFKSADNPLQILVIDPRNPQESHPVSTNGGIAFYPPNSMIYATQQGFIDNDKLKSLVRQYKNFQENYQGMKKLIIRD